MIPLLGIDELRSSGGHMRAETKNEGKDTKEEKNEVKERMQRRIGGKEEEPKR